MHGYYALIIKFLHYDWLLSLLNVLLFAYSNITLKLLFITNEFYFTFQLLICSTIIAFNHTGSNFKYKMFINDFFYWINNIQSTNDLLSVAIYKCTRNYKKNINLSLSLGKT